jgi:preprotein translocase subunit SecF
LPFELIKPDTRIDFIGQAKYAIALSVAIVVLAAASMAVRGVRLGLDFTGGIEVLVALPSGADEEGIRSILGGVGIPEADVVRYGEEGSGEYVVRARRDSAGDQGELVDHLKAALAERFGSAEVQRVDFIGPKVGAELRSNGIKSLAIASLLLLVYIGVRFTPIFAPGAIVAQVHDVVVTAALLVLLNREFDLNVLAALLAILGYSINDKIVIYDRIRENMSIRTTHDFPRMVNESLNQTLSRTVLTGGTAIFSSFALFVWGGPVIATFGLAMALGIIVGTYSSLYITTPILLWLERRYGVSGGGAASTAAASKSAGKPKRSKTARA